MRCVSQKLIPQSYVLNKFHVKLGDLNVKLMLSKSLQNETGDKWEFLVFWRNSIIMRCAFVQFQNILMTYNQMF